MCNPRTHSNIFANVIVCASGSTWQSFYLIEMADSGQGNRKAGLGRRVVTMPREAPMRSIWTRSMSSSRWTSAGRRLWYSTLPQIPKVLGLSWNLQDSVDGEPPCPDKFTYGFRRSAGMEYLIEQRW